MDWQLIAVALMVVMAAAYLVRWAWRSRADRSCAGQCACGGSRGRNGTSGIQIGQLNLRRRP